jgi:hypothetical protein
MPASSATTPTLINSEAAAARLKPANRWIDNRRRRNVQTSFSV